MEHGDARPFPGLLAATAMGTYLLLVAGATTAVADATAACAAWPACGDGFALPATAAGYVALGHRIAAALVGLLVVATVLAARRTALPGRVRAAVLLGALLYPVQAGLGAIVATGGSGDGTLPVVHLGVGMAIFGAFLAALAWTLEVETADRATAAADGSTGSAGGVTTAGSGRPAPDATTAADAATEPADDLPPASAHDPDLPSEPVARAKATALAYVRLTKPRLMWLLCLVAVAAMGLAAADGRPLPPRVAAATLGGGVLAIGASGTLNHVFERDIDRRMARTSDRPLATDLVPVRRALLFAGVLAAGSLALFASVNLLAAALGLAAILFYSVVYTLLLKPNTVQNTVVGGAAGALPALIGWAAVTGEIGLGGLALAALIFLWTPAHFYNLALAYRDDYERAGFPMLPVVRGEATTRKHILWYLGATFALAAGLAALGTLGALYAVAAVAGGAVFLWAVIRLHYEATEAAALRSFHASNAYLGAVLVAIALDTLAV